MTHHEKWLKQRLDNPNTRVRLAVIKAALLFNQSNNWEDLRLYYEHKRLMIFKP